jgi:hypothetical protein
MLIDVLGATPIEMGIKFMDKGFVDDIGKLTDQKGKTTSEKKDYKGKNSRES